jgi:hypothetical protein
MFEFSCPQCGTLQRVADSAVEQIVPCARCGQRLQVPAMSVNRTLIALPGQGTPSARFLSAGRVRVFDSAGRLLLYL